MDGWMVHLALDSQFCFSASLQLEVLHLLTPEQKAELLLHPEMGHLDNETLSLVFESLLESFHNRPGPAVNSTAPKPGNGQTGMGVGVTLGRRPHPGPKGRVCDVSFSRISKPLFTSIFTEIKKLHETSETPGEFYQAYCGLYSDGKYRASPCFFLILHCVLLSSVYFLLHLFCNLVHLQNGLRWPSYSKAAQWFSSLFLVKMPAVRQCSVGMLWESIVLTLSCVRAGVTGHLPLSESSAVSALYQHAGSSNWFFRGQLEGVGVSVLFVYPACPLTFL